jgi:Tfp pilus assembly protein PilV
MNKSSGLTLIEVLISMVILVVGILSVMMMLSTAAKGNAEARKMTRALNVAEAKMDEFLYAGLECTGSGSQNGYSWSLDDTEATPPDDTTYCRVTVTWTSSGDQKSVMLETLRSD